MIVRKASDDRGLRTMITFRSVSVSDRCGDPRVRERVRDGGGCGCGCGCGCGIQGLSCDPPGFTAARNKERTEAFVQGLSVNVRLVIIFLG